jgi:secondary thiamine-phosphate synthase enzyme
MIYQKEISLTPFRRGIYLITSEIISHLDNLPSVGLLNILLKHTSAAITLNENADPMVRQDFNNFMDHMVPDNTPYFVHTLEGADDMPAHIKSSVLGQSLTIPITNCRLNLGTWQGIYLCEFRNNGGQRKLVLTVYG